MIPQAFIFIGRSGCGKGTQVELLIKKLKEKDPITDVLYIQTGLEFRKFIEEDSISAIKSKKVYDDGGLQPEFLTVRMWVDPLVANYTGKEHLIFDGTPRKIHEAGVLDSVFGFYGFPKPWVINIDISNDEAVKRLLSRKRLDDNEEDIRSRLSWYETSVEPAINFYKDNPNYNFIKIDGERSVEDIHHDIVKSVVLM